MIAEFIRFYEFLIIRALHSGKEQIAVAVVTVFMIKLSNTPVKSDSPYVRNN